MPNWFEKLIGVELAAACEQDNVAAIKRLTVHNPPKNWSNVLAIAAADGALQVAAYCIVEQSAVVDDVVLQHVICNSRSEHVYRFFVDAGHVDVDYSLEHWGTMLGTAASKGHNSLVDFLLRKGADPNCRVQSLLRKTALACAAGWSGGDEETLRLLLDYGAQLHGSGALVFAAERGKVANVQFLLARGADVDEMGVEDPGDRRSRGKLGTALHKAVEAGHGEVVEILLAAGANQELKDAKGRTAADIDEAQGRNVLPSSRLTMFLKFCG